MKRPGFIRRVVAPVALLGLGACAEAEIVVHAVKQVMESEPAPTGYYKVGQPYTVGGRWYYPKDEPDYSTEGIASWYGPQFNGLGTANGEIFDQNALTAAHATLAMPSYVRVTNLENGRALVLRVNDRGPFVGDRIIDVSKRAAQLLGFLEKGTARVRVEAVPGPDEGTTVAVQPVTSGIVLASVSGVYVQAGAFADAGRADDVRAALAAVGPVAVTTVGAGAKRLYRVRVGPFAGLDGAEPALARVQALGFRDALITIE